ncbi:MCE family protein [Leptospira gomenensis]|uniref:MCE family protein n=1 Tax=Leptospira gomenensis TaxID=2484974 RepID=A0A5F1YES2_9LEPT|nr:MCE family protein [Leptospira gomenensis]TGK34362.1 MCE family protein [Leptospira gomenensis]TGK37277.1 MCE family protein [Leptospira gomenensis]TGK50964.1 MCE family protein [Leptospira gomenensis]TGK56586.1 MCE family protein [Leptospira gomenensis]
MNLTRHTAVLTGVIFFLSFALGMYISVIEKAGTKDDYPYTMKIYYPRLEGIHPGAPVRILGVERGIVRSIDVVPIEEVGDQRFLKKEQTKAIEIVIRLKEPITLWDNYKITFQTNTILSGRTIDIDPGSSEKEDTTFFQPTYLEEEQRPPDFLPSADYFDDFFAASTGVIRENREDIRVSFNNLYEISEKLKSRRGTIPQMIHSPETYDNVMELLTDARIFGTDARRYAEGYRKLERSAPTPFTINMYRRTTLIGSVSNDYYFGKL